MRRLFVLFALILLVTPVYAQVFPLEIILPKASGTGTPAIPSTHRIYKAYTGLEYNIRAAVIGGEYPYVYSLTNAPSGMTIDSKTGEITWTDPQSNSGTITLTVTDSADTPNQVQSTWAITVGTSGFVFVNASYSGTETGSITQPYSSLSNLLTNESSISTIVYFRSGLYTIYDNDTLHTRFDLTGEPSFWLAYPEESVTINGNDLADLGTGYGGIYCPQMYYMDGLTFSDYTNKILQSSSGDFDYSVVRNCTFSDLDDSSSTNYNFGMIGCGHGTVGHYWVVQDNDFSEWSGASAIGSIYYTEEILIENNYLHGTNSGGSSGLNNAISPKYDCNTLTVRGNKIITASGYLLGASSNGHFIDTDDVEICHNLFVRTGTRGPAVLFNMGYTEGPQLETHFYRNTLIGDLGFSRIDGTNCSLAGPWYVRNNVITNPNTNYSEYTADSYLTYRVTLGGTPSDCINDSDNLKNTTASTLVDSADEYKLQSAYSSYVGSRGWQLADGSTPMSADAGASHTMFQSAGGNLLQSTGGHLTQ